MITLHAIANVPLVGPGTDLPALVRDRVRPGDVVVVAQKIISKAEGY